MLDDVTRPLFNVYGSWILFLCSSDHWTLQWLPPSHCSALQQGGFLCTLWQYIDIDYQRTLPSEIFRDRKFISTFRKYPRLPRVGDIEVRDSDWVMRRRGPVDISNDTMIRSCSSRLKDILIFCSELWREKWNMFPWVYLLILLRTECTGNIRVGRGICKIWLIGDTGWHWNLTRLAASSQLKK